MTHDTELAVVRRAGRIAAIQASLALAAVLLVVGAVIYPVDVRVQNRQIADQLTSVASTADDAPDPPPGMQLVLRDVAGKVQASSVDLPSADLLARPPGFSDARIDGVSNRVLVADKPQGRVVALLALDSYEAGRSRLLLSLGAAELAGILASVGVVVLLTRHSIRPLAEALTLQRRFVADASHELRAPLTVLHNRIQLLARRFDDGDAHEAKEQIDALAADTRALGEVIEDLLASASMSSNGAPRVRVDVSAIANEVRDSMAEHANSADVALVVEREDGTGAADFVVLGSAAALRRAVTSLVDNALAHEHAGGEIAIYVARRGANVVIEVRDDGVGIDPDAMATLFTRFSHGQVTPRPRVGSATAQDWRWSARSCSRTAAASMSRKQQAVERLSRSLSPLPREPESRVSVFVDVAALCAGRERLSLSLTAARDIPAKILRAPLLPSPGTSPKRDQRFDRITTVHAGDQVILPLRLSQAARRAEHRRVV